MTGREGKKGRLLKYPEWEEYQLFDSDDLWSEHCYLLYGEPGKGGNQVFVWIGQDMEGVSDRGVFAQKVVEEFQQSMKGWPVGAVTAVVEFKEPEVFWDYFSWG